MINQQIKMLDSEAQVADDARVLEILDQITALISENAKRMEAAKAKFYGFSEDAQYSGELNAAQTAPFTNFAKYGKQDEMLDSCEFWELAADGAEMAECETAH